MSQEYQSCRPVQNRRRILLPINGMIAKDTHSKGIDENPLAIRYSRSEKLNGSNDQSVSGAESWQTCVAISILKLLKCPSVTVFVSADPSDEVEAAKPGKRMRLPFWIHSLLYSAFFNFDLCGR